MPLETRRRIIWQPTHTLQQNNIMFKPLHKIYKYNRSEVK